MPDTRPKWNAPDLRCPRDYTMSDGSRVTEIDAETERRYREHMMSASSLPTYKHDPTYNMRRK
jgi:hypothetical protein